MSKMLPRTLILALAFLCVLCLWPADDTFAAPRRRVLIVYSWHDAMPWQAGIRAGLHERLQQVPEAERPEIYEERIDAGRIAAAAGDVSYGYLRDKYAGVPLDAVVAESQAAANLLFRHADLFPAAKRYAVNVAQSGNIPPERVFVVKEDAGRALLTIPSLMRDCERVVAVVDTTAVAGRTRDGLIAAVRPPGVALEIYEGFSFDELYAKAANLPPRSALLYFPIFQDRDGVREIPRRVVERLAQVANAPIFVHHDSFLGTGVVGGYLLSSRRVGELIARVALDMPPPRNAAEVDAIIKGYQFDDRQLKRWRIDEDMLPTPREIVGRAPALWTTYRWEIGIAGLALLLQALLIAALVRALSQRRKAAAQLAGERDLLTQRTAELEAANKELQDFSYAISHDLRSPLRAVAGFAQIVADEHGSQIDAEGRRLLSRVREGAERMGQLIDSLVDFMSIARRRLNRCEIDVGKLARDIFNERSAAQPPRNLRLEVGELPHAWGDHALLRLMLENLLANAVKFIPVEADGVIVLSGEVAGGETVYHLVDNGVGFDMRYADKLFKVFERLHAPNEFAGIGVGLAVVKRIVGRHGGRVWGEGQVGVGATLHFALPVRPPAPIGRAGRYAKTVAEEI